MVLYCYSGTAIVVQSSILRTRGPILNRRMRLDAIASRDTVKSAQLGPHRVPSQHP